MAINHRDFGAGTLGFFAKRGAQLGLVSCNHVIARKDDFKDGDDVLGANENDVVGKLAKVVKLSQPGVLFADCAFATVAQGRFPANPGSLGADGVLGQPANVIIRKELPVAKQGQKTLRRIGKVVACKMFVMVDYDPPNVTFKR